MTRLSEDVLVDLDTEEALNEVLCVGEDIVEERQKRPTRLDRHVRLEEYLEERRLARELSCLDGWAEEK